MLKKFRILSFLLCLLAICTSCSKVSDTGSTPLVLVSISPYQTLVEMIAKDTVQIKVCVPEDFNAHLFEPTPKQMKGYNRAKLWLSVGMPFEKKLMGSLKTLNPSLEIVNLSRGIPIISDTEDNFVFGSSCGHSHDSGHNHDHEDLHFWMSPTLMMTQAETITSALSEKFPNNAEFYKKNLKNLLEKLSTLDGEITSILTPYKGSAVITSHPSLTYFCKNYGLIQISIECEGKSPLPKDISKILSLTREHHTLCVFIQEQFDNKGALAIAKKLKLPTYKLNPHDPAYFANMKKIATEISKISEKPS
ncbi:MAG: High-affinity zinc uptake system binding-protein ZnuA [Chlamydiia bacterium]|nr:High-affinity zinc uptake system binding-protein ZnuA [Chlamydiia bacterium]